MKDHKVILSLPLITTLSAILHACSQSLARSRNNKERNILCNPLTKGMDGKDSRSPMLPIVPDPFSTIGSTVLLPPFDSRYSNGLSTETSPKTLSLSKTIKALNNACRAGSTDIQQRVRLVDGYGSIRLYPRISSKPAPSGGGPGTPDGVRGKSPADYRLIACLGIKSVGSTYWPGIEAVEHPRDVLISILGSG